MKRGRRGTKAERVLAIVGMLMWATWIVLNGLSPFTLIFGSIAFVISVSEYRRWLRRERISSGSREGRLTYPRWAWFAVGAVPSTFLVGVVWGLVLVISGRTYEEVPPLVGVLGIVAWIAGGLVTERLLVRAAERREAAARSAAPPLPPPPPGTPPATSGASPKEERRPRNEPAPKPHQDLKQDPRGRF